MKLETPSKRFLGSVFVTLAFLFLVVALGSQNVFASSATLYVKAVTANTSASGPALWSSTTYNSSCVQSTGSLCTARHTTQNQIGSPSPDNTTNTQTTSSCTFSYTKNCNPPGDYYALVNFSGLNFPSSADSTSACAQQTTSCAPLWVNETILPATLGYHESVVSTVSNGSQYVYVIGGYNGSSYEKQVWRSGVGSGGSLGSWVSDQTLPATLYSHSSVVLTVSNGSQYVYVLGGLNSSYDRRVWRSGVGSDGSLGSWVSDQTLPATLAYHESVVLNASNGSQYVYVLGGLNSSYDRRVWRSGVGSDGSLGSWVSDQTLPATLGYHESVVLNASNGSQYVYVLGGRNSSYDRRVWRSGVGSDGSLGSWVSDQTLPATLYSHSSVVLTVSNGSQYVYVVGGYSSGYQSAVRRAGVSASDGSLGSWVSDQSLPTPIDYLSSVVLNASNGSQYVYVLGGLNDTNYDNGVWRIKPNDYLSGQLWNCDYLFLYSSDCLAATPYSCSGTCPSCNATNSCDTSTCTEITPTVESCAVGSSDQCCTLSCDTSNGCVTSNNNTNCNTPPSASCVNTTYKREYSSPGTCSGCGANNANGSCAYSSYTDSLCGSGSGCCSSGACASNSTGPTDNCCPNGATGEEDSDCTTNVRVNVTSPYPNATVTWVTGVAALVNVSEVSGVAAIKNVTLNFSDRPTQFFQAVNTTAYGSDFWQYNYSLSDAGAGTVTIIAQARNSAGTVLNTSVRTVSSENGTTTGSFSSSTPYAVSVGSSSDVVVNISLNLTNAPSAPMTSANISYSSGLPGGWSLNSTMQQCGNVSVDASCVQPFGVTIPAGTAPVSKTIYWKAQWIENDGSAHSPTLFYSTVVTVSEAAGISVDDSSIVVTVNPDGVAVLNQTFVNNTGNTPANDLDIILTPSSSFVSIALSNVSSNGCSNPSGGTWNCSRLCGGSGCDSVFDPNNLLVNFSVNVPRGTVSQNYSGTLNFTTSNAGYVEVPVNITVPDFGQWSFSTGNLSASFGLNEIGSLGTVSLNNSGNLNLSFSVSCSSLGSAVTVNGSYCNTTPSMLVLSQSSESVAVSLGVGQSSNASFDINFSNASGLPVYNLTGVTLTVTDRLPRAEYAVFSPSVVEIGSNITVTVNVSDDLGLTDSALRFSVAPPSLPALNFTPTRISGSADSLIGNFSLNYSNTTSGNYTLVVYSQDSSSQWNSSTYYFTVAGTTTVSVSSNASAVTVNGVTQSLLASFGLNVSFNNTGYATAYYANASTVLPAEWSADYLSFTDNNNISRSSLDYSVLNVSVPAGTPPGLYSVTPRLSWLEADSSSSSNTTVVGVTVSSNPLVRLSNYSSSFTVFQNASNLSTFVVDAFGNSNISSVNLSCTGDGCSNLTVSFNESSISSLSAGGQRAIAFNITVPAGLVNNTYNFSVYVNASGGLSDSFAVSVTVPPSEGWAFSPTSISFYEVGGSSRNSSGVSLWNYGNLPQNYTLSSSGNITSVLSLNQSSVSSLAAQSSEIIWLPLTVPNSTSYYSGVVTASNGSQSQNLTVGLYSYVFSAELVSPSSSSMATDVVEGIPLNLTARVWLDSTAQSSNASFAVFIGNTSCPVASSSVSGTLWSLSCTLPEVTGALTFDVNLSVNFTLSSGSNLTASSVQSSAVRYRDTTPPQIGWSSLPTVSLGSGTTVMLNMTDADSVAWTNVAIYTPSGTRIHLQNYSVSNISIAIPSSNLTQDEDYAVLVNSSDVVGNVNNTIVYFEVVDAKVLTGTLADAAGNALAAALRFIRPSTGEVLVSNNTEADGTYYVTVGKRLYDFEVETSSNKLRFYGVNISASTTSLTNVDVAPSTVVAISGSSVVRIIAAEPSVSYDQVLLNLSYADSLSSVVYEGNLHLFKCASWVFASRTCPSGWSRVNVSGVDKASNRFAANVSSFSAFAVAENYCGDSVCRTDLGETYSSCPSDCPATLNVSPNATVIQINQTRTSSIAGASSVSLQQYVSQLEQLRNNPYLSQDTREKIAQLLERLKKLKGDEELTSEMIAEIERVLREAQEDLGLHVASQMIYLELYAGEGAVTSAHVKNTLRTASEIKVRVRGDVEAFMSFLKESMVLDPQEDAAFPIAVNVPGETAPGVFHGELILSNERGEIIVPVNIRILEPQEKLLNLEVKTLVDRASPGRDFDVEVNLFNLGEIKRIDLLLVVQFLDPSAENLISEQEFPITLENSVTKVVRFKTDPNAPNGRYIIRATAFYSDLLGRQREASNVAYVDVFVSTLDVMILGIIPLWVVLAVVLVSLAGGAYYYYAKREAERRKRYLEKIDFTKLPAAGPRSAFVGKIAETKVRAFFNCDKLTTHTLVAGATGSGKTVAAQVLVEEALKKGVSVVVFDPTAQWTGFLRAQKNKQMLDQYRDFNMNASEAQAFKGNIRVVKEPDEEIDVKKLMKPGEITVFALNKLKQRQIPKSVIEELVGARKVSLQQAKAGPVKQAAPKAKTGLADPSEIEQFVINSVRKVFDQNLPESKKLKMIFVYDEVHRLLPKFGGSGKGFVQIERGAREFRKWGVGLILISQVLSDFVGEIKANIGTEIQMRTKYEGDLQRIKLKYGEDTLKSVVKTAIGTGMTQNSEYNRGRPYFVSFRPLLHNIVRLSDAELAKYEEYNRKIERFAQTVERMKSAGVDVFDAELELNLAREKLKKGAFNIVDIYIESLEQKTKSLRSRYGK